MVVFALGMDRDVASMNKSIDNLDLLAQLAADLATPIAKELQALFDRGGSKDDGVQLVAALERIALSAVAKKRESARHSARGTRLNADWQPSTAEVQYALDRGRRATA